LYVTLSPVRCAPHYLHAGKLGEQAKDEIEEHVSLLVRTITQSLEALKNGVMAAQQPQQDGQPLINEHMAAHLHGAVRVGLGHQQQHQQ
jgi:hypothetical protein